MGTQKTTLSLSYEDGLSSRSIPLVLKGEGVSPAVLSFSEPGTFDFGSVTTGTVVEHTFTLTNVGGTAATQMRSHPLGSPFAFKDGAYPGTGGTCGTGLQQGGSCTLVVTFAPTSQGPSHSVLSVDFNDGTFGLRSSSRNITGAGASPLQGFTW